jgi:hypothetical protein
MIGKYAESAKETRQTNMQTFGRRSSGFVQIIHSPPGYKAKYIQEISYQVWKWWQNIWHLAIESEMTGER